MRDYGYGGYGGYPTQSYAQPGYAQPSCSQPTAPYYAPYGQTIPPPATGTIGYGYGGAPSYAAPNYAPYGAASPGPGWQSIAPPNAGAQISPRRPSQAMPRNVRPSNNLAWQTPGLGSQVTPVSYPSPLAPSFGNAPASTSMVSVPTSPIATVSADCGCNGSVAPASGALSPQYAPIASPATFYQPTLRR